MKKHPIIHSTRDKLGTALDGHAQSLPYFLGSELTNIYFYEHRSSISDGQFSKTFDRN